jgi:hypothetical protein
MKAGWILIVAAATALPAHAYTAAELRRDCSAAEDLFNAGKSPLAEGPTGPARCVGYVQGFVDGFAVGEYLADSVGVKLNAICPPEGQDATRRLVRSVVAHLERQPPDTRATSASLVGGALSRAFPCSGSLEPRK